MLSHIGRVGARFTNDVEPLQIEELEVAVVVFDWNRLVAALVQPLRRAEQGVARLVVFADDVLTAPDPNIRLLGGCAANAVSVLQRVRFRLAVHHSISLLNMLEQVVEHVGTALAG